MNLSNEIIIIEMDQSSSFAVAAILAPIDEFQIFMRMRLLGNGDRQWDGIRKKQCPQRFTRRVIRTVRTSKTDSRTLGWEREENCESINYISIHRCTIIVYKIISLDDVNAISDERMLNVNATSYLHVYAQWIRTEITWTINNNNNKTNDPAKLCLRRFVDGKSITQKKTWWIRWRKQKWPWLLLV